MIERNLNKVLKKKYYNISVRSVIPITLGVIFK